jgi:hypothetical protein
MSFRAKVRRDIDTRAGYPQLVVRRKRFRQFFETRAQKVAAAIGAAILAGIGGGIATWILTTTQHATKRVLGESAGGPLVVHIAAPGTFFAAHPFAPYYVMSHSRFPAGPNGLSKDARDEKSDSGLDLAWLEAHGGIAGSPQIVRLELRGTADEPVTITAIRPLVVKRSAPVRGWYVASPACGVEPVRVAEINLDKPGSPAEMFDESTGEKIAALSVTRTDAEQIELHAETSRAAAWRARLFYSGPKGDGSVTIDDSGKPFEVTTETASEGYKRSGTSRFAREHEWDQEGIRAC